MALATRLPMFMIPISPPLYLNQQPSFSSRPRLSWRRLRRAMIDVSPDHLAEVQAILREHVPECEVRAFGSRVQETAKPYSDLDLVKDCCAIVSKRRSMVCARRDGVRHRLRRSPGESSWLRQWTGAEGVTVRRQLALAGAEDRTRRESLSERRPEGQPWTGKKREGASSTPP